MKKTLFANFLLSKLKVVYQSPDTMRHITLVSKHNFVALAALYKIGPCAHFHRACNHKNLLSTGKNCFTEKQVTSQNNIIILM